MDGSRFDTLTRILSAPGSRRRALGGLLAGALALVSGDEAEEAAAHDALKKCKKFDDKDKRKKCLKKGKKHNATHTTGCTPSCAGRLCGPDGCGSECGTCPPGWPCRDGVCVCAFAGQACGASAGGLACCSERCGFDPSVGFRCRGLPCAPLGGNCTDTLDCCDGRCDLNTNTCS